jgi:hypothetical protein
MMEMLVGYGETGEFPKFKEYNNDVGNVEP